MSDAACAAFALSVPAVLAVGDSLTQFAWNVPLRGWMAQLQLSYERRAEFINRGLSGYTTRSMLPALPHALGTLGAESGVRAVLLWLGANDASHCERNARQHVPLPEFRASLARIARQLAERFPRAQLLVASPPPVEEERWLSACRARGATASVSDRTNELAAQYAAATGEVAAEVGARFVDFFTLISARDDWRELLGDGLHFSALGNDFVAQQLLAVLAECGLGVDALPLWLPHWSLLDPEHPEKTIEGGASS